jgi:hypothetical protein
MTETFKDKWAKWALVIGLFIASLLLWLWVTIKGRKNFKS